MIKPFVASGDVAPLYIFGNGPAYNAFNRARISIYGVTGTPTVKMDGLPSTASPAAYANVINNRLAIPTYVSIEVSMAGDSTGGTAYISVTAEQDLGITDPIKVWCVIVEDEQPASGSTWGGYNGKILNWLPVAWPMGAVGTQISFTGPYPQTVSVAGSYTLNPGIHTFENLRVVTFVQRIGSTTKEVLNAHYMDLPDATGISEPEEPGGSEGCRLSVWPNPCSGEFSIGAFMPGAVTGVLTVYDIAGREVMTFEAQAVNNLEIQEAGVYIARLATSDGACISQRFSVIN